MEAAHTTDRSRTLKKKSYIPEIAFTHAKYQSRCMICGNMIAKRSLIVLVVDASRMPYKSSTRARWSHPDCVARVAREHSQLALALAQRAYTKRNAKRNKNTRPDGS